MVSLRPQCICLFAVPLLGLARLLLRLKRNRSADSASLTDKKKPPLRIVIVGAGFGGICMAIKLNQAGLVADPAHLVLLERQAEVGGVWLQNTYPGCACDVSSHVYSYSFEPNPYWGRNYSPQKEILNYIVACAKKYGVYDRVQFSTDVVSAKYDATRCEWSVTIRKDAEESVLVCDVFISAVGQLNNPVIPKFEGLSSFEGPHFHSAAWRHDCDLQGKTVAVIGNAASAVQLIPEVAKVVKKLYIFQRSPTYILPRDDFAYPPVVQWVFAHIPFAHTALRWLLYWFMEVRVVAFSPTSWLGAAIRWIAVNHIHRTLRGLSKEQLEPLVPQYPIGYKRVLSSNAYYPTLRRNNVQLVCARVQRIEPKAIITSQGDRLPVDAIVFATGFEPGDGLLSSLDVIGRNGQSLHKAWIPHPYAYKGLVVPGFPNFFILYGPNTNLGHNSIVFMLECQANYIVTLLRQMRAVEIRMDVAKAFDQQVQAQLSGSVWAAATDCPSYYKAIDGAVVTNWAWSTVKYWWWTRKAKLAEFEVTQ